MKKTASADNVSDRFERNKETTTDSIRAEVVGEGATAREVLHVRDPDTGATFDLVRRVGAADDEPRVRDVDLAAWLEFADPRMIRKLIKSQIRAGNINPLRNVYAVERFAEDGSSRGSVRVAEYQLTEEEALFVATRSETAKAVAVTKAMIRVFSRARRGLASEQQHQLLRLYRQQSEAIEQQGAIVAELRAQCARLESRVANDVGQVSPEWAEQNVVLPLRRIAMFEAGTLDHAAVRKARRAAENRLRNAVCFNGPGSRWDRYPRDAQLIKILLRTIDAMTETAMGKATAAIREQAEAKARAEAETRLKQLGLFPAAKN